jgi:hypothetical protein
VTVRHLSADLWFSIGIVGNTVHEEVEFHAERGGWVAYRDFYGRLNNRCFQIAVLHLQPFKEAQKEIWNP